MLSTRSDAIGKQKAPIKISEARPMRYHVEDSSIMLKNNNVPKHAMIGMPHQCIKPVNIIAAMVTMIDVIPMFGLNRCAAIKLFILYILFSQSNFYEYNNRC